jgi:hypothetical protein
MMLYNFLQVGFEFLIFFFLVIHETEGLDLLVFEGLQIGVILILGELLQPKKRLNKKKKKESKKKIK